MRGISEKHMTESYTESFGAGDDFAPASMSSAVSDMHAELAGVPDFSGALVDKDSSLEAIVSVPNGFVKLGLAKELLQAVADMGFNQPTAVQMATIPKAMQALDIDPKAQKFTDLLVSSQTGSGKTAAFLLPVLHTLLMQQEQAERDEKAEFERLSASTRAVRSIDAAELPDVSVPLATSRKVLLAASSALTSILPRNDMLAGPSLTDTVPL